MITAIIYAVMDYFERKKRRREALGEYIANGWKTPIEVRRRHHDRVHC